jgi:peptide deformylase
MVLRVTQYGEPILRKRGSITTTFDADLKALVSDMVETMHDSEGIGLAAQQVDRATMVCVVDVWTRSAEISFLYSLDGKTPPLELIMPMALINPQVKVIDEDPVTAEEGCLSFPGIYGDVDRPDHIEVTFQDIDGAHHALECNGLLARVIQHEVDHLNGILYIDHMEETTLKDLAEELKKLRKQTRRGLHNSGDANTAP